MSKSFHDLYEQIQRERLNEAVSIPQTMNPSRSIAPERMQKFRVTYTMQVTDYVVAQSPNEARRMVWESLSDRATKQGTKKISREESRRISDAAKSAEIVPIKGHTDEKGQPDLEREWAEITNLFSYSLENDYKINPKKYDPNIHKDFPGKFASIDNADLSHLFHFVQNNPDFVREKLETMEPRLRSHLIRAYNVAKERIRSINPKKKSPFWNSQLKDTFNKYQKLVQDQFGKYSIKKPRILPQDPNQAQN